MTQHDNDRAYHQEFMHLMVMAARLGRSVQNAHIGATITDVDFTALACAFGVDGERAATVDAWAPGPTRTTTPSISSSIDAAADDRR